MGNGAEMSRGFLGHAQAAVEVAKNSSTKMWDNLARYLWKEHGIFLFHFMDGRIPQDIRDIFTRRWNLKYGKRP